MTTVNLAQRQRAHAVVVLGASTVTRTKVPSAADQSPASLWSVAARPVAITMELRRVLPIAGAVLLMGTACSGLDDREQGAALAFVDESPAPELAEPATASRVGAADGESLPVDAADDRRTTTTSRTPPTSTAAPEPAPSPSSTVPATTSSSVVTTTVAPATTVTTTPPQGARPSPGSSGTSTSLPAAPATTQPPPPASVSQIAASVRNEIDASSPLGNQRWGQTQAIGSIWQSGEVGDSGVTRNGSIRFGAVSDPAGSGSSVLEYRATATDPATVGGIRTETTHPFLPRGETFWQAVRLRHGDWSGTSDNQIVFQWHSGNHSGSGPSGPILAFYVIGDTMKIVTRHDGSSSPSNDTSNTTTHLQESDTPSAGAWVDLVIQANITPFHDDGGFLRIWRDGTLIVDYVGPIGYNEPGYQDYAKLGLYHWTSWGNDWDVSIPERSVHVHHMAIVDDPGEAYEFADVAGYLRHRTGR